MISRPTNSVVIESLLKRGCKGCRPKYAARLPWHPAWGLELDDGSFMAHWFVDEEAAQEFCDLFKARLNTEETLSPASSDG